MNNDVLNEKEIEVSIICNTYNQEKYIRHAINSFLMQQTNFKYEILIHDDASTDRTTEIIKEYESQFPKIIFPIYQSENQYSKGVYISEKYQYVRARGKYIAICEGDDFWTDSHKLQKQVDVLNNHQELDICTHEASVVSEDETKVIREIAPKKESCIIPIEEVILGGGGFVATNSIMMRASKNVNIPRFRKYLGLDYTIQIDGSLRGGMFYIAENMSSYRSQANGSWTVRMKKDKKKVLEHSKRIENMLKILNEETNYRYNKVIHRHINENQIEDLIMQKKYKEMICKKYMEAFIYMPMWKKKRIVKSIISN